MAHYAFIIPVHGEYYVKEAQVLVKSIRKWCPDVCVIITGIEGDINLDVDHDRIFICKEKGSEFKRIRTFRFKLAMDLKKEYDVVCCLDADMVVFHPLHKFFKLAETGIILACADSTMLTYRKKDFDLYEIPVDEKYIKNHCTISTVPMFLSPSVNEDYLKEIWDNPTGNDLDVPNLVACKMDLIKDRMHLLNNFSWTNIHHSMMKPETYAVRLGGKMYSHQGIPIYMLHGHWIYKKYIEELMNPIKINYPDKKMVETAENSLRELLNEYNKYL